MVNESGHYTLNEDTEIEIEPGELTEEESNWLRKVGVLSIRGHRTETGEVTHAILDAEKLARIAFEYDLLQSAASSVEVDILETFRRYDQDVLTTQQLTEQTNRAKSSVSRALTRLVEKNKITKVQNGVYRF